MMTATELNERINELTDRELLKLAAKAAGIFDFDGDLCQHRSDGTALVISARWNPLKDDGDALRLAVKLGMDIRFSIGCGFVCAGFNLEGPEEDTMQEPYAATRRAIVRAAAELGKDMK